MNQETNQPMKTDANQVATTSTNTGKIVLWALILVMVLMMFVYKMGKEAALRDNRMEQATKAACAANPANCKR
jgi:uncharacterized protein HemX